MTPVDATLETALPADRAEHGRGGDGDLGRTAAAPPHQRRGNIGEEIRTARQQQQPAEQHEHGDNGHADDDRPAQHRRRIEADIADHFGRGHGAGLQLALEDIAVQAVQDEDRDHEQQAYAGGPAQGFDGQRHQHEADDQHLVGIIEGVFGEHREADGEPQAGGEAGDGDRPVGERRLWPGAPAAERPPQEDQRVRRAEDDGDHLLGIERGQAGGARQVGGPGDRQRRDQRSQERAEMPGGGRVPQYGAGGFIRGPGVAAGAHLRNGFRTASCGSRLSGAYCRQIPFSR